MSESWKKLLGYTIIWLASEILLNFVGLDNIADYSEFLFNKHCVALTSLSHQQLFPAKAA